MVFPRRLRPARSSGAEGSAASGERSGHAEPDVSGSVIRGSSNDRSDSIAGDRSKSPRPLNKETSGSPDRFKEDSSGSSGRVEEDTSGSSDPFATEALSYIDSLYGTAMRLTRRAADAEDLVQDTYLKAFRAADQFERGTNLKAWLFTILHNTFRNMRRHDGRNPVDVNSETVEQAVDLHGEQQSPEQLLTRATLDADLQEALDALPDVFRQAVWLRDVEEFSYAEIASMLDVPIGTVMSRISRGRRMLYDRLSKTRNVAGS